VNVVIESIEPEVERLGLTQAQVKADVEAKLRKRILPWPRILNAAVPRLPLCPGDPA